MCTCGTGLVHTRTKISQLQNYLSGSLPTPTADTLRAQRRDHVAHQANPLRRRPPKHRKILSNPRNGAGVHFGSCAEILFMVFLSPLVNLRRLTRLGTWKVVSEYEVLFPRICEAESIECHRPGPLSNQGA